MSNLIGKVKDFNITRRSFLGWTATMAAGTAAAITLPGCGLVQVGGDQATALAEKEGEWITAACWHNCGGRCLNKALVVDGVVIRQKTDDTHPDSLDYPQQRACIRGRSQRHQAFGLDRLKYPMKRKNWAPGGGDKSKRGSDEWVRISWDEALDIVASEIKNARTKYGNKSILSVAQSNSTSSNEIVKALSVTGGVVLHSGTKSWGSWMGTPQYIGDGKFPQNNGGFLHNDRLELMKSETVVMWGANPGWGSPSGGVLHAKRIKDAGAKFISIDPHYSEGASLLEAEWIQIRPVTDTALMLAIAYAMLKMDDPIKNPIIDWDFLKKNTVGFDADSMPEGEDPKGNFKDYVLGTYDGIPKTPEWASKICGTKPEQIEYLAKEFRKDKKVAFMAGWANARNKNVDNLPQLFMTLGAMGGHMGKSGHCTGISTHASAYNGGPSLVKSGANGLPSIKNPVDDTIMDPELWSAVLTGKYNLCGSHDTKVYFKGEQRNVDIHVIYHGGQGAVLQTREGTMQGIEAHKKVDFVVTHAHFLNTQAKYSDVVLPITTEWEKVGGFLSGNREIVIMYSQVTKPLYEAKDEQWIASELIKRLGGDPKKVYPFDDKQQLFNQIVGSTVVTPDGKKMETLVTITEDDIKEWGVQGKPQQGRISLKEFKSRGVYQVERKEGDNFGYIAFKDPDAANPGAPAEPYFNKYKLLIYSKPLETIVNSMGFSKIKAIPTYIAPEDGYEKTFSDWDKQVKGEYPYQVISPHYLRRVHSTLDNIPWLREAWANPVYLNADDAKKNGIAQGDTVLVTSQHGKLLRTACVTERFMPGVVGMPHGSWLDMDEKTGIDTGGNPNTICGAIPTGMGVSGWNTGVCKIEKYKGTPIIPDVQKPQRIVF